MFRIERVIKCKSDKTIWFYKHRICFKTKLHKCVYWILRTLFTLFLCFYAALIILFTFFYTNLQIDPQKTADDLAKNGQYIPGVRPGTETRNYISKVLNRITVLGALLLTFIAILPYVVSIVTGLSQRAAVGGTGIIIVVGVAMDTIKQMKSQMTSKQYKSFVGK